MGLLDRLRRKPEDEQARAARLLSSGRIVEGRILDVAGDNEATPALIFYSYTIQGVEYESSQMLNAQQLSNIRNYSPGARVAIRYDPRQPANSIVV